MRRPPKIYLSTRLWKDNTYVDHKNFFDGIFQKCQEDFNKNGYAGENNVLYKMSEALKGHKHIFEIKQVTKVRGNFRPLWSYAVDYKYFDEKYFNKNDILVYEMSSEHKEISKDAQFIEGKEYAFKEFEKCPIVLDNNQKQFVEDNSEIVIIEGNAGTGKTLICIEKLIDIWNKNKDNKQIKVLFLTYSGKLLEEIKNELNEKYVKYLKEILQDLKSANDTNINSIKEKIVFFDQLFFDVDDKEKLIKQIENFIDFIVTVPEKGNVDYVKLNEQTEKTDQRIVNFNIFQQEFFESENFVNNALKNTYKIKDIDLKFYFDAIEGIILGSRYEPYLDKESYRSTRLEKVSKDFDLNSLQSSKYIDTLYQIFAKYQEFLDGKYVDDGVRIRKYTAQDERKNTPYFCYVDRNSNIKKLLEGKKYDYAIVDEVQDLTQKELISILNVGDKFLFAGDTMQMINPAYFSFKELRKLYSEIKKKSSSEVPKNFLANNYRNSNEIYNLSQAWRKLNTERLRNHSFVLDSTKLINDNYSSKIYYVKDKSVIDRILKLKQDKILNTYFITERELKDKKFFTVSEIKGCEKDNVVLFNLLSNNYNKWKYISEHKFAKDEDENSIYRYYFNMFYVAFTRARHNVVIVEDQSIAKIEEVGLFKNSKFFDNFTLLTKETSDESLEEIFEKLTEEEALIKIEEHIKNQEYKQALQFANKLGNANPNKQTATERCQIYVDFVSNQKFKLACQKFLEKGYYYDAAEIYQRIGRGDIASLLRNVQNEEKVISISDVIKIYYSEENEIIKTFAKEVLDNNANYIQNRLNEEINKMKEL